MAIAFRVSPRIKPAAKVSRSRKDIRLWLGVVLIIFASFIGGKLFTSASHRTPAVVISHDLSAGSLINESDVHLVNVSLPTGVDSITDLSDVVGKYAAHDLIGGSVVHPAGVSETADSSLRAVSVPIKAGHLPALAYGSNVDVWFTPSLDGAIAPGPSQLLASNVLVEAVPELIDSSVDAAITLRVSELAVAQLMQAMRDGSIDIAVVGRNHG